MFNWFGTTFMGQSPFEKQKNVVEGYEGYGDYWDKLSSKLKSEATKGKYGDATFTDKTYGLGDITGKSKDFAGAVREAEATGSTVVEYKGNQYDLKYASYIQAELEKAETSSFFSRMLNNDSGVVDGNPELAQSVNNLREEYNKNSVKQLNSNQTYQEFIEFINANNANVFKAFDDLSKDVKAKSIEIKHSREYMAAQAAAKNKK